MFHVTNSSAPIMLAVAGLVQQPISWLDETLDAHITSVRFLAARQATISVPGPTVIAARSHGLAVTLPLAMLAGLVAAVVVVVSCQRKRARDPALLDSKEFNAAGKCDVFISYRVRTDALLAERLFDKLRAQGFSAWWDKARPASLTRSCMNTK